MPETPKKSRNQKTYQGYEPPEVRQSNTRILILITLMLVLIVITATVFVFLFLNRPPPVTGPVIPQPVLQPPKGNTTMNLSNVTKECDDQCMLQAAVSSSSADLCLNISNVSTKQTCYVLLSNTSVSVCLKLKNETAQMQCVNNHAIVNNDITLCSLLAEPGATSCMAALNPCYANNGTARLLCLALASKNYTICGSDQACILNYSQVTGTSDACSLMILVADQYSCWALASNKDKCSDLEVQAEKDLCYQVFAIGTNDYLLCQAITPDSLYQTECLSFFAMKMKDYTLCDAGLQFNNRWACYTNYSMKSGNVSGCAAINPYATTAKFKCYYDFAKLWGNPSVCDQFDDPVKITTCYVGSIMNNTQLNYSNCAAVGLDQWKNKCYLESAKLNKNAALCDYIITENEKNSCLAEVNK